MSKKLTQAEIKQAFHMEPEEIVKYFESKGLKTSFDWHEVYAEAHAKAFTVAKMTNMDLLKDTQGLLTKAIKEGWSEGHFKREASILFNKKGWTGLKEVTDPKTGETKTVELGTPRRIRTIFESNIRSAYAAGRYKKQLEDADIAPYLQYMCTMDNRTRPEHAAMNEKVFRYDDPIWQSIYPPNGFGCRCFVRQLGEGELKRSGLKCESSEGHLRQVIDIIGGEERPNTAYDFKVGTKTFTLKPDAGWGTNQALNSSNYDLLAYDKMKNFNWGLKSNIINELNTNPIKINQTSRVIEYAIKEVENQTYKYKKDISTLAWLNPEILQYLEHNKIKNIGGIIIFSDYDIGHLLRTQKNISQVLTAEQVRRMPINFRKPTAVFYDTQDSALIYVQKLPENEIIEGKDIIKFVVKPQANKKAGRIVWEFKTAGRVNYKRDILNQNRYKKIELSKGGLAFPPSNEP